jgi:glycosyltransferase involved in cell wall biosynthesis
LKTRVTSPRPPEQKESHAGLLDKSRRVPTHARFDAIVVPTYRPVKGLRSCIDLAQRTEAPLIVVCSRAVRQDEVIRRAARANVEAFAFDLPHGNPLGIDFATSEDKEISAASPGWNRDLSMKRNLGLVLARLLGWERLMFLDDDILGVTEDDVAALSAALEGHNVSALIPTRFPDNSVVCHAHRLGGGKQDVFASASGIGVKCDRDELGFFPNLYNEDWFFFAEDAANHKIARVGESRQRAYDPYDDPVRAAREEFGDLLAEGLYARLDVKEGIWDVDAKYWQDFIKSRMKFHQEVERALGDVEDRDTATRAGNSVRVAQEQLTRITPELCQKFVWLWQADLLKWRSYLANLPSLDGILTAFKYLEIDPARHPVNQSRHGT